MPFFFFFRCTTTDNLVPVSITVSLGESQLLTSAKTRWLQAVDLVYVPLSGLPRVSFSPFCYPSRAGGYIIPCQSRQPPAPTLLAGWWGQGWAVFKDSQGAQKPTVCGIYARQRCTPPCKVSSRSWPEPSWVLNPCELGVGCWGQRENEGSGGQLERVRERRRTGKGMKEERGDCQIQGQTSWPDNLESHFPSLHFLNCYKIQTRKRPTQASIGIMLH